MASSSTSTTTATPAPFLESDSRGLTADSRASLLASTDEYVFLEEEKRQIAKDALAYFQPEWHFSTEPNPPYQCFRIPEIDFDGVSIGITKVGYTVKF